VSKLLSDHATQITELRKIVSSTVGEEAANSQSPYNSDVFYLRYCLEDDSSAAERLKSMVDWRQSVAGKAVCEAAVAAVEEATASSDGRSWNNEPVRTAALHASKINQYITPSNCITTTSSADDLVYCIRAGAIDDNSLMKTVTVEQMVEFFLYVKEVLFLTANLRSKETDKLLSVITANDLSGVKLVGGSADFRNALSQSSKQANRIYPVALTGPTLLLNLPKLLSALVKLFTPLFPAAVRERIKFVQGPLSDVSDLSQVGRTGRKREAFVKQLDEILYNNNNNNK
jgi:hypothetical protein